jgi:hypothetical protein
MFTGLGADEALSQRLEHRLQRDQILSVVIDEKDRRPMPEPLRLARPKRVADLAARGLATWPGERCLSFRR